MTESATPPNAESTMNDDAERAAFVAGWDMQRQRRDEFGHAGEVVYAWRDYQAEKAKAIPAVATPSDQGKAESAPPSSTTPEGAQAVDAQDLDNIPDFIEPPFFVTRGALGQWIVSYRWEGRLLAVAPPWDDGQIAKTICRSLNEIVYEEIQTYHSDASTVAAQSSSSSSSSSLPGSIRELLAEWDREVAKYGIWTSGHAIATRMAERLREAATALSPSRPHFYCQTCGPTGVDEDGCCRLCGADTEALSTGEQRGRVE